MAAPNHLEPWANPPNIFGGAPMQAFMAQMNAAQNWSPQQRQQQPAPQERSVPQSPLAAYASPSSPMPSASASGDDMSRAAAAISRIESGGRYDLTGPVTRTGDRAYGRYQVMGANIPEWTQRHVGRRMAPDEFLADQAAQDAVFQGQFGEYLRRYGPQDAASMWFTGQPYAVGRTRSDAIPGVHPGLTGEQYVSRFMSGY